MSLCALMLASKYSSMYLCIKPCSCIIQDSLHKQDWKNESHHFSRKCAYLKVSQAVVQVIIKIAAHQWRLEESRRLLHSLWSKIK